MTRPCFQALQSSWITGLFPYLTAYPALYAIIGSTTLPSLAGRFLEGSSGTVRSYKAAGLPNITGTFGIKSYEYSYTGAFYYASTGLTNSQGASQNGTSYGFDASKSNSIYGNSTTVQPKSYTVNYLIKAY